MHVHGRNAAIPLAQRRRWQSEARPGEGGDTPMGISPSQLIQPELSVHFAKLLTVIGVKIGGCGMRKSQIAAASARRRVKWQFWQRPWAAAKNASLP
jgi:hypothetical protein